jgi:hypothetical protein
MDSKGTNGGARMMEQEGVTEDCISERRLWTAVVVTAVEDWRNGSLRARREAQSFLFEDNTDFQRAARSHARAIFSMDGGIITIFGVRLFGFSQYFITYRYQFI